MILGVSPSTKMSGFTIVELLIVITLAAILTAVGVPSFRYVMNANRIASEVNGMLGDMQFARSEAIKEGETVTICSSANGTACAASTSWQSGWIVFSDTNHNAIVDVGEPIWRYQKPFSANDTFVADNSINSVTFNRDGFAAYLPNNVTTVTITLHDPTANAAWTRCLAITLVGMLSTQTAGTGNCT